jgi:uncharacterized spore protein YtfJ
MQDLEQLLAKTVAETEKMLTTKTVVGEPISIGGFTLIPLVSVGFAVGAAGGAGNDPKKGGGSGNGIGAGGGVKPIALVIVGPDGVRLESIKSGAASVADKAVDAIRAAVKDRAIPAAVPSTT